MRIHQFIYVIAELPGGDVTDSGPETKKLQEEELHFVSGFIQDIPLTKNYLRTWMKRSERQLTYLFSTAASLPIINLTQLDIFLSYSTTVRIYVFQLQIRQHVWSKPI